jgi:curved DNA-binding protein CbpA
MNTQTTLYEILNISHQANDDEIKTAFRKLAKQYHPDVNENNEYFNTKFNEINNAYRILINKSLRNEYDINLGKNNTNSSIKEDKEREPKEKYEYNYERKKTERNYPQFNLDNSNLDANLLFFAFPKFIGNSIWGESTVNKDDKKFSKKDYIKHLIKTNRISYFLIASYSIYLAVKYPSISSTIKSFIFFILINSIIIYIRYLFNINKMKFIHRNMFVCEQGIAIFLCENNINNLIYNKEISYIDVENIYFSEVPLYAGFIYKKTDYVIIYTNSRNEILYKNSGEYQNSDRNPEFESNEVFWFHKKSIEQYTKFKLPEYLNKINSNEVCIFNNLFYGFSVEQVLINKIGLVYHQGPEEYIINFENILSVEIKRNRIIINTNIKNSNSWLNKNTKHSIDTVYLSNKNILYKLLELNSYIKGKIIYKL